MDVQVRDAGTVKVIEVAGRVDWENARDLDIEITKLIRAGCRYVVVDINGVSFMCSGGIGTIVHNFSKLQKARGAMYIISSTEYMEELFQTLKFHIVFAG